MKKLLYILLSYFLFVLISGHSYLIYCSERYPEIKILESNGNRLVIEFTPINLEKKSFRYGQETFDVLDFKNSIPQTALSNKFAGKPDLGFRSILIGMPSLLDNRVRIISSEYETINNVNIAPIPKHIKSTDAAAFSFLYEKDPKEYNRNGFYPEQMVSIAEPGIAREFILANLIIYPFQYNPVTKEIRRYKKITVEVLFGNKNPSTIIKSITSEKETDNPLKNSVINYEQVKSWKVRGISFSKTLNTQVFNSVLATGDWYKLEVPDDGIYKLDAKFFRDAGINLSSFDPRTIKIYGNGGEEVPESISEPRASDLVECAIYVSGESDGIFNDNDFVLFYGKGPSGWKYDSLTKKFSHYINHYSNSNYYFLTFGGSTKGKRMSTQSSLNSANPFKSKTIMNKYFLEPEVTNLIRSGREWFGTKLYDGYPSNTYTYLTPQFDGLIGDTSIIYRIQCIARAAGFSSFNLEQNNQLLGQINVYLGSDFIFGTGSYAEKSDIAELVKKTDIKDNKFNFKLTYVPRSTSDEGYLDWIEIFYQRSMTTTNDEINFYTPETNGAVEYNFDGFTSSNIFVFNVTEHDNVKILSGSSVSGGNIRFQVNAISGNPSCYYAAAEGNKGFKTISSIKKIKNSNLHGISDGAEFIIVTHSDFLSEAERYRSYRQSSIKNPLKTLVFDLESTYNEFSGGLTDPTAIRDFVKYAYDNWTVKPRYLLLFGDGNYDYKNISKIAGGQDRNRVPPYETLESLYQIESYCTDDYYVRINGEDNRNDLAVGRIPAGNTAEAKIAVDKIISYESGNIYGPWRNTLTFVADDGITSVGDDGEKYTSQSEDLAENITPISFEKKKIFIVAYKTEITSTGRKKPDANQAIIDQFNNGTLMINYIGHGNPELWAHEDIFDRSVSIPALNNKDKLTFVVAATCDFGRYDDVQGQSGTEDLINKEDGGSIGTFSTSRSVFADENFFITKAFYQDLFNRDQNRLLNRIGDVTYSVKQDYLSTNDNKFHLIGDPTIRLNAPQYIAAIDSINGISPDNQIQLKALSKVALKGEIFKDNSSSWKDYNGKILATVNDASKTIQIIEGYGNFVFKQSGGILYRGECTIKNGIFSSTFFIPKDISYENNYGRISLYFQGNDNDGSGYNTNIIIGGTDTTNNIDNKGPVINIFLNDRNFHSGDLVGENPRLIVDLFDENGINVSGGIGHRFQAWLDNSISSISLDEYYKGKIDSYQEGSAEYTLSNISNGNHNLKVKAFDVFNNSSTQEIEFKVSAQSDLTIQHVLNYPNPFSRTTKFTFEQNQDIPIDVTIKIYTIAGRLIKTIREYGLLDHFVQIEWDGRDEDGDELANGVYLYKVITRTQDGKFTNEALGKLSVLR